MFEIRIELDRKLFKKEIKKKVEYYRNFFDDAIFDDDFIVVKGKRAAKINLETAINSPKSTYLNAIINTLLYVYFSKNCFVINKIEMKILKRDNNTHNILETIDSISLSKDEVMQRFENDIGTNFLFEDEILSILFLKNEEAYLLNRVLSYLTLATSDKKIAFENYWKSFEVLGKKISDKTKLSDMVRVLRTHFENNLNLYSRTLEFTNDINVKYLEKFSFNKLIKSKFTFKDKNTEFKNLRDHMLLAFHDSRVCEILLSKITIKKDLLSIFDPKENIKKELKKRIKSSKIVPLDIVRLLILKHAFYLRNKYIHAEKKPLNFLVEQDELDETKKLSEILKLLIYDMVESKSYYK